MPPSFPVLSPPTTDVSSPDFRSTPTIDQGLGLGRGLGFGRAVTLFSMLLDDGVGATVVVVVEVVRGFGSGDVPLVSPDVNLEARRPTMEPFNSSLFVVGGGAGVAISFVGEVRFATSPVDLLFLRVSEDRDKNKYNTN